MKKLLKIIFSIVIFAVLWYLTNALVLTLYVGITQRNIFERPSGIVAIIGLISIFTSIKILKEIHKIRFIKKFFNSKKTYETDMGESYTESEEYVSNEKISEQEKWYKIINWFKEGWKGVLGVFMVFQVINHFRNTPDYIKYTINDAEQLTKDFDLEPKI